jgi:hypothetical protein
VACDELLTAADHMALAEEAPPSWEATLNLMKSMGYEQICDRRTFVLIFRDVLTIIDRYFADILSADASVIADMCGFIKLMQHFADTVPALHGAKLNAIVQASAFNHTFCAVEQLVEDPKFDKLGTSQVFIHRVFNERGVTSWVRAWLDDYNFFGMSDHSKKSPHVP